MPYVSQEEISRAREIDLLTYLRNYEPDMLIHVAGNTYCTREHDSLKISNGKWNWFSRGIGGRTALDYLVKVQKLTLPQAVERILGGTAIMPPFSFVRTQPTTRKLLLPEKNETANVVVNYLMGRGIHSEVIDYCLGHRLLYESKKYHNAVFVGYDLEGRPRYAALRGTVGGYKGEATGSDKRYSFSIVGNRGTRSIHLFESAIDLMSFATLRRMKGYDWQQEAMLSLAGVYLTKRANVVPIALSRFLADYPHIRSLRLRLDNDEVGCSAAKGIIGGLSDKFEVHDEPAPKGKDVNEYLQIKLGINRIKEDRTR